METNLLLALKQFQHNVEVNPDCLRNLIGEKLLEEQFSMVADTWKSHTNLTHPVKVF